jgi:hypothetical protein
MNTYHAAADGSGKDTSKDVHIGNIQMGILTLAVTLQL